MNRRLHLAGLGAALGAALLSGCASVATLRSEVATYGEWPAGRRGGTFAFERLPSQQAQAPAQESLEAAARPALEAAGFRPVAAGAEPDVLVQLGARVTRTEPSPWDDPLWWRGGFGYWRHGPWLGPTWPSWRLGVRTDLPRVDREAALLLRDRASGKPLYEARARNDTLGVGHHRALRAMFEAAMKDFPATGPNPRDVTVPLAD
jgi:hypothetical protein